MKIILTATAALAMVLSGSMASAQDRHNDYRSQDHRQDDRGMGRDRGDRRDRGDHRAGPGRGPGDRGGHGRYARGQRYQGDGTYLSNYRRYGYRAPPRGYRYYRANNGDVVLAAVATGIISSIIASGNR